MFRQISQNSQFGQVIEIGRRTFSHRLSTGFHNLPVVTGQCSGVARAGRAYNCAHCDGIVVAGELHMINDCPLIIRQQYAALFTSNTDTTRSFFHKKITCKFSSLLQIVLLYYFYVHVIKLVGWLQHCHVSL